MPTNVREGLSRSFIPELNGLRAIAISLVFLHHTSGLIPRVNLPVALLGLYLTQGWMGVDLFFVISGFLITGILLDTRECGNYFSGFYARRVLRIFPLYYVVLTAILAGGAALKSDVVSSVLPLPADRWLYYCYLTNWISLWKAQWVPGYTNFVAHFWSLAVEEQFYLAWPLIVWLLRPRTVPYAAGALTAFAFVIRLCWVSYAGEQQVIAWNTFTRMDSLFIGAICACIYRDAALLAKVRKWLPWTAVAGLGGYLVSYTLLELRALGFPAILLRLAKWGSAQYCGYTLIGIGFASILLMAVQGNENSWMRRILRDRLIGRLGTYSYGFYVFHVPIFGAACIFAFPAIARLNPDAVIAGPACILLLSVVTFIVSALSYELFEKRILGFKRYFEPRYTRSESASSIEGTEPASAEAGGN